MRAIAIIVLAALPFVAIGFFAGLCFAKASYFQTIRWQQKQIRHIQRHATVAVKEAAKRGFDAGYMQSVYRQQKTKI